MLLRAPRVMYGSSGSSTSMPLPAQDPPAARGVQWPIGALPAGVLQGGFLGLSQADLLAAGGQATWPPAPAGAHAHAAAQAPPSLPHLLAALSPAAVSPMRGVKPEVTGEHWAGAQMGVGPGGGTAGSAAQALDGDASWSLGSQVRCQPAVSPKCVRTAGPCGVPWAWLSSKGRGVGALVLGSPLLLQSQHAGRAQRRAGAFARQVHAGCRPHASAGTGRRLMVQCSTASQQPSRSCACLWPHEGARGVCMRGIWRAHSWLHWLPRWGLPWFLLRVQLWKWGSCLWELIAFCRVGAPFTALSVCTRGINWVLGLLTG